MTYPTLRALKGVLLLAGVLSSQSWGLPASETPTPSLDPLVSSAEQPLRSHLPAEAAKGVWAQIEADQYRVRRLTEGADTPAASETLYAPNFQQAYRTYFEPDGPQLILGGADAERGGTNTFSLALVSVQQGAQSVQPKMRAQRMDTQQKNRIVYTREHGIEEWYINRGRGLEQGFTLHQAIDDQASPALTLQLQASAGWSAGQSEKDIQFTRNDAQLSYRGLKVWDADQRSLPAQMHALPGGQVRIQVDARHARYPITIDPVIQNEDKKLTASDGAANDHFGWSVAISGDSLVVGAYFDDDNGPSSGSVYLFDRNHGGTDNWGEAKKLIARDGAAPDLFGRSVAIDGDTLIVGAPWSSASADYAGSAFVFSRHHGGTDNWGEVKMLTASDSASDDYFGYSVAISGDNLAVSAYGNDDSGSSSGSAYVFNRDHGGSDNWGEVKKLTASDSEAADYFGWSVAMSGDNLVAGALWDDDNGNSSGSAYVFNRDLGGSDNWGEAQKLTASDGASNDYFGWSTSISGDNLVVGALWDDDNGTNSGAAYVFNRDQGSGENWTEVQKLTASDGEEGESFGTSVSISGDSIVVGADKNNSIDSGAAYLFGRDQGSEPNWEEIKKLTASDDAVGFGISVAISGDSIVVGANEGSNDNGTSTGAAYVFHSPIRVLSVSLAGDRLDTDHIGASQGAQLLVTFSSAAYDPSGDFGTDDVSNTMHYALYAPGSDGVIDSALSEGCLLGAQGDDVSLPIDSASYDATSRTVTLSVNGGANLPKGTYSLLVCGSTPSSVSDNFLTPLDGNGDGISGDDYVLNFELNEEGFCFPIKAGNGNVAIVCL